MKQYIIQASLIGVMLVLGIGSYYAEGFLAHKMEIWLGFQFPWPSRHSHADCAGCMEALELLSLQAKNSDIHETPLHIATRYGCKTLISMLLKDTVDMYAKDDRGQTPLWLAVEHGLLDILTLFMAHGFDVKSEEGDRALYAAIERGSLETPTNVNELFLGNKEMAEFLLKNGANPNYGISGDTLLHMAAGQGDLAIVELLLAYGAQVDAQDNFDEMTPLHLAVARNRDAVVKALLAHGAQINARDKDGETPLFYTISRLRNGYINKSMMELLLAHGADINVRTNEEQTILHAIALYPDENAHDVAAYLIAQGADAHAKDNEGKTPYMLAVGFEEEMEEKEKYTEIVTFFAQYEEVLCFH